MYLREALQGFRHASVMRHDRRIAYDYSQLRQVSDAAKAAEALAHGRPFLLALRKVRSQGLTDSFAILDCPRR